MWSLPSSGAAGVLMDGCGVGGVAVVFARQLSGMPWHWWFGEACRGG